MLLLEWHPSRRFLSLAHDLHLDAFCSDVVEHELGARGTLGVYPSSDTNLDIFEVLARLDGIIALEEVSQIGCDIEFVGVGIGTLGLSQLLDFAASDLIVLLGLVTTLNIEVRCVVERMHVRWGSNCFLPLQQR